MLPDFKPYLTHNGDILQAFKDIRDASRITMSYGSKNTFELRKKYFKNYPELKSINLILFRLMYLDHLYGIDATSYLYALFPKDELEAMKANLLQDTEAIAMLSTHACNFLYLYEKVVKKNSTVSTDIFFEAAKLYDLSNDLHIQLLLYLYTHCIIGETKFYYTALPVSTLSTYQTMLHELDDIIAQNYDQIGLDNKFEFLVCAKIANYNTSLTERIHAEAQSSVSVNGSFLVDTHNQRSQSSSKDFARSEHRNVLFLMSLRDFKPLKSS